MTKNTKSPYHDIDWPKRPMHGDIKRQQFATALTEIMREQKLSANDLAAKMFGRDPKTKAILQADAIRNYMNGEKFPTPDNGGKLCKVLKVPLSRLLSPKGPLIAATERPTKGATHSAGPRPPLPLPDGAPPLSFKMEDFKKDPRFAVVSINGVAEIDDAMAIFALIHRK